MLFALRGTVGPKSPVSVRVLASSGLSSAFRLLGCFPKDDVPREGWQACGNPAYRVSSFSHPCQSSGGGCSLVLRRPPQSQSHLGTEGRGAQGKVAAHSR